MKGLRITLLLLTVIQFLCACLPSEPEAQNPVNFYYIRPEIQYGTGRNVLISHVWDAADHYGDMRYVLESYLLSPVPEDMVSPFPDELALVAVWNVGDCLHVKLNESITELSGLELTLACSCIAKTCFEIWQNDQIRISSSNGLLDGADYIDIRADSLLLSEIEMTVPEV